MTIIDTDYDDLKRFKHVMLYSHFPCRSVLNEAQYWLEILCKSGEIEKKVFLTVRAQNFRS